LNHEVSQVCIDKGLFRLTILGENWNLDIHKRGNFYFGLTAGPVLLHTHHYAPQNQPIFTAIRPKPDSSCERQRFVPFCAEEAVFY